MLALRRVTKRYGDRTVVDDVDVTFGAGRTTVLIGPSGCGKTTVLKMLIGLIAPDAGTVSLAGDDLGRAIATEPDVRARFGYVIQSGGLFPHLTARDNVALPARYRSWPPDRVATRIDELATLARFPADGLDRYPTQLSGGQRQRIGLMRALVLDPDILLLDEPLGALDPMVRAELQEELADLFRRLEKTVVLVTHDLNEAARLGDEIVLLADGRVVQTGTARDFRTRPASDFVTAFVNAQAAHFAAEGDE